MPVANGNGIIGGGSLQTDGPGLQAFSVQPYSAKRGSTSCLSTVSIISPGRAARTMHLSKKTAIGIVITLLGFELTVITRCSRPPLHRPHSDPMPHGRLPPTKRQRQQDSISTAIQRPVSLWSSFQILNVHSANLSTSP